MKIAYVFFFTILLFSCTLQKHSFIDRKYDLKNPTVFYTLSDTLLEISGLTDIDSTHIGCVQDEKGIIFIYSLEEARIVSEEIFHMDGDYEGITRVGKDMYVLRSDGFIFKINDYNSGKISNRDSIDTGIPITNNEGLCFDEKNNRLLIAAKGKMKGDKNLKDTRFVYAFDLDSNKMSDKPILTLEIEDIANKMIEKKMEVPIMEKMNGDLKYTDLKFLPSSIALHPKDDLLFILSAVDGLLAVINRNGTLEDIVKLDSVLFPKPEGITFLSNGDMLISNEGKGGKANLMRFDEK